KELLFDKIFNKKGILLNLINRRDNQILNIDFLFECLREMNDIEFNDNFIQTFENNRYRYYKINQDQIIELLDSALNNEDVTRESDHKLFELLLYMFLNNWSSEIEQRS